MQKLHQLGLTIVALVALASTMTRALERPQPPSPLLDYLHQVDLDRPAHYRNLTVFPLNSTRPSRPDVLSFDEAVRSHELMVGEIGQGEVNSLSVENVGKEPVYIMAGEILEGAKQTRVLQSDILVPPHSGRLEIGAFCVEHGRWSYQSSDKNFTSGGLVSNPAVRAQAQVSRDQGSVWAEVDNTHRRLQVPEQTGALTEAYRAPQVQDDVMPYVRALQGLPEDDPQMVGAVVLLDNRVLCADSFGPHHLLSDLWPKLIRSYALEAVADGNSDGYNPPPTREAVQAFLRRVDEANIEKQSTPGLGLLEDIEGPTVTGSALLFQQWPLHIALFPHQGHATMREEDQVPAIQRSYPR